MSVCILQCGKKQTSSDIPFYLRINNDRSIGIEENKNILTHNDIITLQPLYFSLPLTSPVETKLLLKIFKITIIQTAGTMKSSKNACPIIF